jgi:endonuclease-3
VGVKTARDVQSVVEVLGRHHPDANTELRFSTPFELLVATVLSAQTTDAGVNRVTPALFARYPDAQALAAADPADVERLVQATGFFRQKTRSLLGIAQALSENHEGQVPRTMDALVRLPGVGRKTANVVLGHALGVPGLPVDRHVLRVSNRIGIATSDDPERVEQQLTGALPPSMWTVASDRLILHGRRICKPKPLCDRCLVAPHCAFRWAALAPAATRKRRPGRAPGGSALGRPGRRK